MRHFARHWRLVLPLASCVALASLNAQQAVSPFDSLHFRSIGPAVTGGRMDDVQALPGDPSTIYVGAATGGVWKTTNKGTTWTPVFDNEGSSSMGSIAIYQPNPDIIWLGTGEQNNRQSSSWGDGVYRTTDGGEHWTHLGLVQTRAIGRVLAHPSDPNVAWVAAQGNLWKPSAERGVFKTTDAGRTWTKVLYVDTLTGATDLVMDPRDPNVLYAAMYQRLRTPWGFNGGGPGSGIWKTTDGGAHWTELTDGIPDGDKGRIGLAISRSNPDVVMATIEHATETGTYRSEDGGTTWRRMSRTNPRPMYYSAIYIDPTNDRRVYILWNGVMMSEDGGATFRNMPGQPTYDVGLKTDHHALWIDPTNTRHLYLVGDGGMYESWDMANSWIRMNDIPVGQFYAIGADNRDPYWVYGGMQDNHSWMGPSATRHWLGIVNTDWKQIGFSDGVYQQPDPFNPRWVFSNSDQQNIQRVDIETGDRLDIKPTPALGDSAYRFDWAAPILASRLTPGLVYAGGNRLFISRDHGETWRATKDLTRQVNRDTLSIMGVSETVPMLSKNDGESTYSEITTIAESPLDARVVWVGTDDGNVQLSRDGGATWTELSHNISGVPDGTSLSRVVGSSAGRGAAYATFDGHRSGDFAPYAFRTTDYGRTWTKVVSGLPSDQSVRTLHEYPGDAGVVFIGTERSLYVSTDTAKTWTKLSANLPTTRYDDILVHPRTKDLILGTHGRSIWILDDASVITQWSPAVASERLHVFRSPPATIFQYWADFSNWGQGYYAGENPADGATISYSLSQPAGTVKVTIRGADGRVVRTLTGSGSAGVVHRVMWDLRHEPPATYGRGGFGGGGVAGGGRGGRGGRGGGQQSAVAQEAAAIAAAEVAALPHDIGNRGPFVSPGTFTAVVEANGATARTTIRVLPDPKLPLTTAQYRVRESFLLEVEATQRQLADFSREVATLNRRLSARRDSLPSGSPARTDVESKLQKLMDLSRNLVGGRGGGAGRLSSIAGSFNGNGEQQGSLYPPTPEDRAQLRQVQRALERARQAFAEVSR